MKFKGKSQKTFLQKVYFDKVKDINTHLKARDAYNKKKEMDQYLKENPSEKEVHIIKDIILPDNEKTSDEKNQKLFNIMKKFQTLSLTTEEEFHDVTIEIDNYSEDKVHVFEVMTNKVRSVIESTTMGNCIALISQYNISSLPVINPFNRQLVGIITMKDIINHILDQDNLKNFVLTDGFSSFQNNSFYFFEEPVSKYMKTNLITVEPEEEISVATKKMLDHKIHRLIVARDNRLIGIFSAFDVLKIVSKFGISKFQEEQVS